MKRESPFKAMFNIRKGELPLALLMFSYFFLVITSFWILKPIKKSLFIGFYQVDGFNLGTWHLQASQAELIAKVLNMVVAFAAAVPVWAAGTVEEVTFYSDALGMEKSFQIYLPEGYDTSGISYPVVYYIHGMSSDYLGHQNFTDAAEDMISRGLI